MVNFSNSDPLLSNSSRPLPPLPPFPPSDTANTEEGNGLRQILSLVQRRILLIVSVAFAISSVMTMQTLKKPTLYQSGFRLLVEPVRSINKLEGLTDARGSSKETALDYDTQIQILTSPQLISDIIEEEDYGIRTRYPNISYGEIVSNLSISRRGDTKILEVRYKDNDPQKIYYILERLAVGYLRYASQKQETNLRQGLGFVNDQLPEVEARVNNLQAQVEQFRQRYNLIEPDSQAEKLSGQASNLASQRLEVEQQLVDLQARYQILQEQSGSALTLNSASNYQNLIGQIRQLETQIALESSRYRSNSLTIQNLLNQRQNLLPLLEEEAQQVLGSSNAQLINEMRLLQVRLDSISQIEDQVNAQIEQMPTLARQYTFLQRELNLATGSLNRFLEKRESLQIQTAETEVPWQLLAAPVPPEAPISPNVPREIMMGIIMGLVAGFGAAFLLEKVDNVFYTLEDLKDKNKLPILGVIPNNKKLKEWRKLTTKSSETEPTLDLDFEASSNHSEPEIELDLESSELTEATIPYVLGYNFLPFLESFRTLCGNIGFLSSDTPIRSFVISSPLQGDGKSTVAVHLAQAAAAMGRRVLLVDANLRLPQIHTQFSLPNQPGLSNLINADLSPDQVIQKLPRWDNLFVLPSGQIPPDATKLLSSNRMQSLMRQLREQFDWVIYDTPSCLDVVDSRILAPHTDGLLMVVRLKKTDKPALKQTLESLKLSHHQVLGLVVNGTLTTNSLSSYYQASTANNSAQNLQNAES